MEVGDPGRLKPEDEKVMERVSVLGEEEEEEEEETERGHV